MKYYLPNQNFRYLQTNRSDRLGSIWSSKNLDFQKKLGTLKLSDKLVTNTTSSDVTGLGLPVAFEFWDSVWIAICGTKMFRSATDEITTAFSEDTSKYVTGGSATTRYDITNPAGTTFRYTYDGTGTNPNITALNYPIGGIVVIADTDFNANNEGTFTITGSGANYFEVTNAGGVAESDKVINNAYGIGVSGGVFGSDYSPLYSDLAYYNGYLFNTTETALRMTVTAGLGDETIANIYTLTSGIPHKLAYIKQRDRLYFIYNFRTIGSLSSTYAPIISGEYSINLGSSVGAINTMTATSTYMWIGSLPSSSKTRGAISQWDGSSPFVQKEYVLESGGVVAMCSSGDIPYAIDTEGRILKYTGYSFDEIARLPIDRMLLVNATASGQKFIHQNGFIATKNNTLLINVNNLNEDANSTINENLASGIWELDLSTNNLTHKYSPTLKTMASGTVTDFGQNRIVSAGAIKMNYKESDSTAGRSTLLAGFTYYTNASDSKSAIFIDSPDKANTDLEGQKRGYLVTTYFESFEITENWLRLWAVYKKFTNATDKLIFKYRFNEEDPIEATITWTSTTTFTTTTDVSAYVGYEVEYIQGNGSGACSQIVSATDNAGTWTVVIDNAITGMTGTAKARFQKWIKLGEMSGTIMDYGQLPIINKSSPKIQIKCILEWTGDSELLKMIINSTSQIKIDS